MSKPPSKMPPDPPSKPPTTAGAVAKSAPKKELNSPAIQYLNNNIMRLKKVNGLDLLNMIEDNKTNQEIARIQQKILAIVPPPKRTPEQKKELILCGQYQALRDAKILEHRAYIPQRCVAICSTGVTSSCFFLTIDGVQTCVGLSIYSPSKALVALAHLDDQSFETAGGISAPASADRKKGADQNQQYYNTYIAEILKMMSAKDLHISLIISQDPYGKELGNVILRSFETCNIPKAQICCNPHGVELAKEKLNKNELPFKFQGQGLPSEACVLSLHTGQLMRYGKDSEVVRSADTRGTLEAVLGFPPNLELLYLDKGVVELQNRQEAFIFNAKTNWVTAQPYKQEEIVSAIKGAFASPELFPKEITSLIPQYTAGSLTAQPVKGPTIYSSHLHKPSPLLSLASPEPTTTVPTPANTTAAVTTTTAAGNADDSNLPKKFTPSGGSHP